MSVPRPGDSVAVPVIRVPISAAMCQGWQGYALGVKLNPQEKKIKTLMKEILKFADNEHIGISSAAARTKMNDLQREYQYLLTHSEQSVQKTVMTAPSTTPAVATTPTTHTVVPDTAHLHSIPRVYADTVPNPTEPNTLWVRTDAASTALLAGYRMRSPPRFAQVYRDSAGQAVMLTNTAGVPAGYTQLNVFYYLYER